MGDVPADASLTYLFSDVEGSMRLWERHPEAMQGGWPATTPSCVLRSRVAAGRW